MSTRFFTNFGDNTLLKKFKGIFELLKRQLQKGI